MYASKKQADFAEEKKSRPVLLIFPFGRLSHYLRCLMLAKHFSPYFDIYFAHDDRYAGFVEKENFSTFYCPGLDAEYVIECVKKFNFSWINEDTLEPVYHEQVNIIQRLKPVAVLGDTSPTLKMAAEKAGVLYISLMNGYMSKYLLHARKLSRTHSTYWLLKEFPGVIVDLFTHAGEQIAFYQVHRPFRQMRKRHRLSLTKNYLDELEGNINLICDLAELFPQKLLPSDYTFISPLFYESTVASTDLADKLDKSKKTIFVSMGSTGDWHKVSFLNHPAFQEYNLVAAGDVENVLHATNIIKTGFANTQELFPFTDLVICHGGNGTIYQSLVYGIPVLCKTNHFEQEWNIDAIERFKLGKSLDEITHLHDYISLVAEWIDKKQKGLGDYPGKIQMQQKGYRRL